MTSGHVLSLSTLVDCSCGWRRAVFLTLSFYALIRNCVPLAVPFSNIILVINWLACQHGQLCSCGWRRAVFLTLLYNSSVQYSFTRRLVWHHCGLSLSIYVLIRNCVPLAGGVVSFSNIELVINWLAWQHGQLCSWGWGWAGRFGWPTRQGPALAPGSSPGQSGSTPR